jgi:outer membrane translocation and assembly module TamA
VRRRRILAWAFIALSTGILGGCSNGPVKLCDNVILREGRLKLSKNERVLVCGSDAGQTEGWRKVPLLQAQYQIKVLLQNQGYLHPHFERKDGRLEVWSGPIEKVGRFEVRGADGILRSGDKRHVIEAPMSPPVLDEVKQWADTGLRSRGYACPTIDVQAQAWDRALVVDVRKGERQKVAGIEYVGLESLDPQSIARYQSFEPGAWYDVRETRITAARMLNDGLFQTAYFTTKCRGDKVDLRLETSVGKPRILRFGIGASTEEFPFFRTWYRNSRLDARASSFTSTLYASPRTQSLDVSSELFYVPFSRRSYFNPRLSFARVSENAYEAINGRLGLDLGRMWDQWKTRFQGRLGPTLNYVDTVRGIGPQHSSFLSWEGALLAMSHEYELGLRDQYSGWRAGLNYRGQRTGIGSPVSVDRYELNFKYLYDLAGYAPPLFVVASRIQAVGVNALDSGRLPVDYRVFYGGDETLRGFGRKSLNNNGLGYLTALYFGLELRLVEELPYRIQPFVLFDSAQLGDRRYTLNAPIFTSQGFGVRWASPFGTLRGSAARGRIFDEDQSSQGYPQNWVYFLSFGQEF